MVGPWRGGATSFAASIVPSLQPPNLSSTSSSLLPSPLPRHQEDKDMMIDVEEELPPMSVQGEIQDKVGKPTSRRKPRPRLYLATAVRSSQRIGPRCARGGRACG